MTTITLCDVIHAGSRVASLPGHRNMAWQFLWVQTIYRCNVMAIGISHSSCEYLGQAWASPAL